MRDDGQNLVGGDLSLARQAPNGNAGGVSSHYIQDARGSRLGDLVLGVARQQLDALVDVVAHQVEFGEQVEDIPARPEEMRGPVEQVGVFTVDRHRDLGFDHCLEAAGPEGDKKIRGVAARRYWRPERLVHDPWSGRDQRRPAWEMRFKQ